MRYRSISHPTRESTSRTGTANSGSRTLAKLKAQRTEVTCIPKLDDNRSHIWWLALYALIQSRTSHDITLTIVPSNWPTIANAHAVLARSCTLKSLMRYCATALANNIWHVNWGLTSFISMVSSTKIGSNRAGVGSPSVANAHAVLARSCSLK